MANANWERDLEIWERHIRHESQYAIAAHYGITQARVSQILEKMRGTIPKATKEALILQTTELYARLIEEALTIGATVDDDNALISASDRLTALRVVKEISAEMRKMHGVDAATKVEADTTVKYLIEGVNTEDLT